MELKLTGGKTVTIKEVRMADVLALLNDVQDGNEKSIVQTALPLVCDMSLDEIIALPVSDIERIQDSVKRKNKSFVNVCKAMKQDAWLNQILTVFGSAVMKVLADQYFPDLMKSAQEAIEKNAG